MEIARLMNRSGWWFPVIFFSANHEDDHKLRCGLLFFGMFREDVPSFSDSPIQKEFLVGELLERLPNFKRLFVKWGWTRSLVFSISWRTCWPPRARAITHSCALVALATDGQPELLLFLGHSHRWKTQSEQGKEISHPIFKDMIPFLLKELLGCSNVPKLTRKRLPSLLEWAFSPAKLDTKVA